MDSIKDLRETIAQKYAALERLRIARRQCDEIFIDNRKTFGALAWASFENFRTSLAAAFAETDGEIRNLERRLERAEREAAVLIKPQPRGVQAEGWDA